MDGWIVIAIIVIVLFLSTFFTSVLVIPAFRKSRKTIEQTAGKNYLNSIEYFIILLI